MAKEMAEKSRGEIQPWQDFGRYIGERAQLEAEIVREELGSKQMNAIITATTEEELDEAMKMAGLVGLRDLDDGTEIQINSWHVAPGTRSDFSNRFGVFAVMECTLLATGRPINLDTGVERVIVWLRARELMKGDDAFPVTRKVTKTITGSGNEVITLLPIPARVANA